MFIPSRRQRSDIQEASELAASIMLDLDKIPGPERRQQASTYLRHRCVTLGIRMRRILSRDAGARSFKPFDGRPLTHAELFIFAAQALSICESRQRVDRGATAPQRIEPAF